MTQVGASLSGTPLMLTALAVGAASVARPIDAKTAGVWTALGAAPPVWWLVFEESTAAVFGAQTVLGSTLWSAALAFSLFVTFILILTLAVSSAMAGAWVRQQGDSLVGRVAPK